MQAPPTSGADLLSSGADATPLNVPTPSARDYGSNKGGAAGRDGPERPSLKRMLTPTAKDNLTAPSMVEKWAGARELMAMLNRALTMRLQTARASDADRGGRGDLIQVLRGNKDNSSHGGRAPLPTPTASTGGAEPDGVTGRKLVTVVSRRLATPTARDWRSGKASEATLSKNSRPLNEQLCALGISEATALLATYLWLMAWPTDYGDMAYPSAPSKPSSRAGGRRSATRSSSRSCGPS